MKLSIRRRLTLWYASLLAASLIVFGAILYYSLFKVVTDDVEKQIDSVAGMMVHAVIGPKGRLIVPRAFDLPLPPFTEATPLGFRAIAPAALEALRAEESPGALPGHALRAYAALLREAQTPAAREGALAFAAEVRDFLVVEGRADVLSELARLVSAPGLDDARTLRALVLAQPPETESVPPGLEPIEQLPLLAQQGFKRSDGRFTLGSGGHGSQAPDGACWSRRLTSWHDRQPLTSGFAHKSGHYPTELVFRQQAAVLKELSPACCPWRVSSA